MSEKQIKENEFFPAPGGTAGTVNYQTGYGTHSSPDVTQNPDHFQHSEKHLGNKSNTTKEPVKPGELQQDVDAVFSKKETPSPDEVVTGIKYELGQQIKKDKAKAKAEVLKNLKKDPKFYSSLKMLNVDDDSMVANMNESKHPNDAPARSKVTPNVEETKKIFAEMAKGKEKQFVVNSGIVDVMKQMWEEKQARSAWKKNGG